MEYNFFGILSEFDKFKSIYDFSDYIKDMQRIQNKLMNFDRYSADDLIKELTTKYSISLKDIGLKLDTGRMPTTINYTNQEKQIKSKKTDEQLKDDLIYIYNCIPLIALLKAGVKKLITGGIL